MFKKFLDIVFPPGPGCPICGDKADAYGACARCRQEITDTGGYAACTACGRYRPILRGTAGGLCPECRISPPPFYPARSLGLYQGLLKESIYLFKYGGCTSLAGFFGLLLAEIYMTEPKYPRYPVLVPVPLSQQKMQARGFNQSELVAAEIGRTLNLPVSSALKRIAHTTSQSKLTRIARREMIKGVFALDHKLKAPDVILVDDILTTGSTVAECTRILLDSGVRTVGVLTIAAGIQENQI
ncbi:MAG: ComF family protein [Thermincola sp.]|nr:ComF family protein [Thermincola sp.]MDT3703392.1 ComF family protein [Thermincola sp.]